MQSSRRVSLAISTTLLATLLVACGGKPKPVDHPKTVLMERVYNGDMRESLCVLTGPFPFEARPRGDKCRNCDTLLSLGLLSSDLINDGDTPVERFNLTVEGRRHYYEALDSETIENIHRQREARGATDTLPPLEDASRPRMCFGKLKFKHIEETLAPMPMGGVTFLSAKIVAEVQDPSPLLWDAGLAPFKFTIPPKPKDGQPVLTAPRVFTYRIMPDGNDADLDSMRYGKWVNEK